MRSSRSLAVVALVLLCTALPSAQRRTLDIYWIDVEGGAATLVVSPSGESLLYDAGWEVDGRDGKRIAKRVGFYLFDYRAGDPADHDNEVEVARWMPLTEAVSALSYRGEREMAERALARVRR